MAERERHSEDIATSPAASGPAGSLFEAQVGAYYLLAMLTEAEPRGLPGTLIDRIAFQRAAEGRPLDDVIVHAHDNRGVAAILEIQVKRSITFTPTDPIFKSVVGQIVKVCARADFWPSRYDLAIATARTSRKIDGAYQDVLTWARQIGDAATFTARINRPGSANPDMRAFVQTFRAHLIDFGLPADDEMVWQLLRRLQILVFDFTVEGSASEQLAKERAARALHPGDTVRVGNLWHTLAELAIRVAATGGDRTRNDLIEDLTRQSFRLAGSRRNSTSRAILAEASRHALGDIADRVGEVMLTRHERVTAVHTALGHGRYVEIRGDAGVGKSGILKHFAEQIATESGVLVLSPNRTIPRGWLAMRSVLQFDGTARDFLSDLACGGGAVVFVDNLDFFTDEERMTVVDLVREASGISGVAVVASRRNFGVEETNWLPKEALDRLGRAEPIIVDELSDAEVEELQHAATSLAPLLADNHPARAVTRNLFRLARIAGQRQGNPVPRTEAEMALLWWQTADGDFGNGHRERMRLLKDVAIHALSSAGPVGISNHPSQAIGSLIESETLREMRTDEVVLRHDVLREWAIANLLHCEPERLEALPLDRPAPPALARGIELAAQLLLAHAKDSIKWQVLLERLSRPGVHGSWRRAALLALVHSEAAHELLSRASDVLLADRGLVLRELIRTVMAVDVQPASTMLPASEVTPPVPLAGIFIPFGPSWPRLIVWLLGLGKDLPAAVIPDVTALYTAWPLWAWGQDPLTPKLMHWLYSWLTEIEDTRDSRTLHDLRDPFGGEIEYRRLRSLEDELRTGFLMFCNQTPDLAKAYLLSLLQRRHNHEVVRSILKFRGRLAQAAPEELVELTARALIPKVGADKHHDRDELREPFDHADYLFVPASPAQGPFLELLTDAPKQGLALVHRLVDHAISFYTKGRECGSDSITIAFPNGARIFPWQGSYLWSREGGVPSCVTSALMALEAWAHKRIESGDTVDLVLADVLGEPGSQASYLLIVVDLLLSHWPKTREAAILFLACPELLCLDRQRAVFENLDIPDREPAGSATLASLKNRVSRRVVLEALLERVALSGPVEQRETLAGLLHQASLRLGPPDKESDFSDPAFMVVHALNSIDSTNWHEKSVTLDDGTQKAIWEYVPPEAERRHLAPLQAASWESTEYSNFQAKISLALEDPSRSSAEFAAMAVAWAQNAAGSKRDADPDEGWMREEAVIAAALITVRDGDEDLVLRHGKWARDVFTRALLTKEDPVRRHRSGLRFNPPAIAFVGLVVATKKSPSTEDVAKILGAAASDDPSSAHGFGAASKVLASIDERLPRAVLRCAFAASIRTSSKWGLPEEEVAARTAHRSRRIGTALEAELAWLADEREEPDWPVFPPEEARQRQRIGMRGQADKISPKRKAARLEEYCDHHAAALWLSNAGNLYDVAKRPWLRDIARAYITWTAAANGAGLDDCDSYRSPIEWNNAFFVLLAHCLPGLQMREISALALGPINSLPDKQFFDVMAPFLQRIDVLYFDGGNIDETMAISIRTFLAARLMSSHGWRYLRGSQGTSIEVHIGPAIATLFFNCNGSYFPAKCYLSPECIDRVAKALPVLENLAETAPSFFVANVTLNLVEVSPRLTHLSFIVGAAKVWLAAYPDDSDFWVANSIGHRLCVWIENVWRQDPEQFGADQEIRREVDVLLAGLVRLGVAEARQLEEVLNKG